MRLILKTAPDRILTPLIGQAHYGNIKQAGFSYGGLPELLYKPT